jgi:Na+/H+-translocating membrane pyrophosphatase
MIIATQANFRTTYCAKHSVGAAFKTAYRSGCAMGFALVSLGLLVLTILILIFKSGYGLGNYSTNNQYFRRLF